MMEGFRGLIISSQPAAAPLDACLEYLDCAEEAGTSVNGGQSVLNPWFIIGGVASSVCAKNEYIM